MTSKIKIPKRVAGVKLPKKVRRKAKKALKVAGSPILREIAVAAMGAAAEAKGSGRRAGNGNAEPDTPCLHTRASVRIDGSKVAEAFREAALDGLRRFLDGFEEGLRQPPAPDAADQSPKRRRPNRPSADAAAE